MHETKFANEIILTVKNKVSKDTLPKNVTVNARLSSFSHVSPKALNETFKQLASVENLGGVKLKIAPTELELRCRSCGHTSKTREAAFNCPLCSSTDVDINRGPEFFIESIDIEDASE